MVQASLAGKRVLELGGYVAGPFAGRMLADLGAEVIKIESPKGDPTRTMVRGGPGGNFIAFNPGKKSLCLDLHKEEGRAVFNRLLTTVDIVVHNLSPDSTRRLMVTYEDCHRVKSDIIYCQIKGYGPGPLENSIASNPIVEASTGVMFANRVNGRPTRLGLPFHDMFAGNYAVVGILAALTSKSGDDASRRVEVGLYETGLYVAARDLVGEELNAREREREPRHGPAEFRFPGYGAYETAEGRWIYLVMLTDEHWSKFCEVMSLAEGSDASLTTTRLRQQRREHVEKLVSTTIKALTFETVAQRLQSVGFGFTEVKSPAEVLNEPQAQQPGKVDTISFQGNDYHVPHFPVLSGSVRTVQDVPPPLLGEHTLEIVRSLGYGTAECDDLLQQRVISVSK